MDSEKNRGAALSDILLAGTELGELVLAMKRAESWTVPGYMCRLVNRANQKLQVLLHNAEYLTAEVTRPCDGFDCPDCKGQGGLFVPTRSGAHRVTCATCEGKGYLP